MYLPSYPVVKRTNDYSEYKFLSVGVRGTIKKLVVFEQMFADENVYNVALLDEMGNISSDTNVSNNGDMREILATVARILIDYTAAFPERMIFFTGSDEEGKRMAVYNRAIREYYSELKELFYIEGITFENVKEPFDPSVLYQAFLVKRK